MCTQRAYHRQVVRRHSSNDPTQRAIAHMASKKLLVNARKCVERSKALIKGSRDLIEASRESRKQEPS